MVIERMQRAPGSWGLQVIDLDSGAAVLSHNPDEVLKTASSAKVTLLMAVAAAVDRGDLTLSQPINRRSTPPAHDSGLWQYLATHVLPLGDVATLVGAVSDNWATNALIAALGGVGMIPPHPAVTLHDIVRDERGPSDPPALSTGSAAGYANLLGELWQTTNTRVLDWLSTGTDFSMVAAAFGLDPLAHADADRGIRIINKTGTDAGVRADSGLIFTPTRTLAYSCLVNWHPTLGDPERDEVLEVMRAVGAHLRDENR